MDAKKIRDIAREAGFSITSPFGLPFSIGVEGSNEALEAFARLIAADCADTCHQLSFTKQGPSAEAKHQRHICAQAIRARYGVSNG